MGTETGMAPHSRGMIRPGFALSPALSNDEGAGNAGCWPHPRALRARKVHLAHASNDRAAETTGTPCAMVLTAAPRSPWCTGRVSHHRPGIIFTRLDPSVGGTGPHGLAVRIERARLARRYVHRIPPPTFVTIAKRPSGSERDAWETITYFRKTEVEYFRGHGLT
jgi:hypothetical protein